MSSRHFHRLHLPIGCNVQVCAANVRWQERRCSCAVQRSMRPLRRRTRRRRWRRGWWPASRTVTRVLRLFRRRWISSSSCPPSTSSQATTTLSPSPAQRSIQNSYIRFKTENKNMLERTKRYNNVKKTWNVFSYICDLYRAQILQEDPEAICTYEPSNASLVQWYWYPTINMI